MRACLDNHRNGAMGSHKNQNERHQNRVKTDDNRQSVHIRPDGFTPPSVGSQSNRSYYNGHQHGSTYNPAPTSNGGNENVPSYPERNVRLANNSRVNSSELLNVSSEKNDYGQTWKITGSSKTTETHQNGRYHDDRRPEINLHIKLQPKPLERAKSQDDNLVRDAESENDLTKPTMQWKFENPLYRPRLDSTALQNGYNGLKNKISGKLPKLLHDENNSKSEKHQRSLRAVPLTVVKRTQLPGYFHENNSRFADVVKVQSGTRNVSDRPKLNYLGRRDIKSSIDLAYPKYPKVDLSKYCHFQNINVDCNRISSADAIIESWKADTANDESQTYPLNANYVNSPQDSVSYHKMNGINGRYSTQIVATERNQQKLYHGSTALNDVQTETKEQNNNYILNNIISASREQLVATQFSHGQNSPITSSQYSRNGVVLRNSASLCMTQHGARGQAGQGATGQAGQGARGHEGQGVRGHSVHALRQSLRLNRTLSIDEIMGRNRDA